MSIISILKIYFSTYCIELESKPIRIVWQEV